MRALALVLLFMLAGCAAQGTPREAEPIPLAPDQVILPTAWQHVPATETAAPRPWWKALHDPVLDDLIAQALDHNPEIKVATARLDEIRTIVADADHGDEVAAMAQLRAAEADVHVVQLEVSHAVTAAYADARLAEKKRGMLQQRMQLALELTTRLHRKLEAGLINARLLRESEQAGIDTREAAAKNHQKHRQALARLALLSGQAPIAFTLAPGPDLFAVALVVQPDLPSTVMDRRPDVQAAWQRLLAAIAVDGDNDSLPLGVQLEQADAAPAGREALYRKSVFAALQEVEVALSVWRLADQQNRAAADALEMQSANVHDLERELTAGRVSRIEGIHAALAENQALESVLQAQYGRINAYAAAQLALASD